MGRILTSAINWSCFTNYTKHWNKKLKEKKKRKNKEKTDYAVKASRGYERKTKKRRKLITKRIR